ncbi:hypothetical protein PISMIDRAFT_124478 [Pisolithus microcarpus 441]|uniref:Uncharacterized protein n=1 Tax=Pisolithus microcarpus 441 TaxID=765257 RepID=A0A0D0A962_9AGAM|nr:hypothetical protein BKA83DRAFT_124478 [Pisolithus microcarpus]KIK30882.1 hypothetical protein PISMIDRAFT_124478 [Pisolithus microcarpus 441]
MLNSSVKQHLAVLLGVIKGSITECQAMRGDIVKSFPLSAPPLVAVRYLPQARRTNTEKPEGLLRVVVVVHSYVPGLRVLRSPFGQGHVWSRPS